MIDFNKERPKTNFWLGKAEDENFTSLCFLPEGLQVEVITTGSTSIFELKRNAICLALNIDPTINLKDQNDYVIIYVSDMGNLKETNDEQIYLFSLDIYYPVFKFATNHEMIESNSRISQLLTGYGQDINEVSKRSEELRKFIKSLDNEVVQIEESIRNGTIDTRINQLYYHHITQNPQLSDNCLKVIEESKRVDAIFYYLVNNKNNFFEIRFPLNASISYVKKLIKQTGLKNDFRIDGDFVLKLVGKRAYLLGKYDKVAKRFDEETELFNHLEVQKSFANNFIINITYVLKRQIDLPPFLPPMSVKKETIRALSNKSTIKECTWNISKNFMLSLKIKNVQCEMPKSRYFIKASMFHGIRVISEGSDTGVHYGHELNWDENILFTKSIKHIPKDAIICMVLFKLSGKSSEVKKKNFMEVGWLNLPIFNHEGMIVNDEMTRLIYTTESSRKIGYFDPLGTCLQRLEPDKFPILTFSLETDKKNLYFPSDLEIITNYCSKYNFYPKIPPLKQGDISIFSTILKWNTFKSISPEVSAELWNLRYQCMNNYPILLVRLLESLPDVSKKLYTELRYLISQWSIIDPENAIYLFNCGCGFYFVKEYALKCLSIMNDDAVELYLPQLVQALKMEIYLDNPLKSFLLNRAINNRIIGHCFFWNLFVEIQSSPTNYYFVVLIESYFKVVPFHFDELRKQVEFLNRLKKYYYYAKSNGINEKGKMIALFKKYTERPDIMSSFCNFYNPLDPKQLLTSLIVEDCVVMESKKKPILLTFKSEDQFDKPIKILFKMGDDLRQDTITLQSIKIMDKKWEDKGQSINLLLYKVLPTGPNEGLIEFVENSKTLGKIQSSEGFQKDALYNWMVSKFSNGATRKENAIKRAVKAFYDSCAGYTIATFILGVGDRHNDNIMLHENGKLFHIDYGHIVGNFKTFRGIKRERVSFVMINEFLYAANNGNEGGDAFKSEYAEYCCNLYMTIRESARLVLYPLLFALDCDLPELKNMKDLQYVFNMLALDETESSARDFFKSKFNEAIDKSWFTMMNFMAHNFRTENASGKVPSSISFEIELE